MLYDDAMNLNPAIQVREAADGDFQQADRLLWEVLWRPVGLARDIRERFKLPGRETVFVAVDARGVVGAIVGQAVSDREMEIRHLAVAEDCQRKGVGGALVARLLDRCRELEVRTVCTHARNTSQAFFEREGFAAVPGETLTHPDFGRHGISFLKMRRTIEQRQEGHCGQRMMDVTCRMIRQGEEQQVFSLIERVFDEFVRSDFTAEGVAEFLRAARLMVFERPPDHFTMVAISGDRIVGMIDMKGYSHVCLFFVDARCHGRGIGRRLFDNALAVCRNAKPDLAEVDVNSSVWAVPVYERLGFKQTQPEQTINGILFVTMSRLLIPPKCDS